MRLETEEKTDEHSQRDLKAKWVQLRQELMEARDERRVDDAKELSKEINKIVRAIRRRRNTAHVEKLFQEFRGLKYVKAMRGNATKHHINAMRNKEGVMVTSRKPISNVFADFYELLYSPSGLDVAWGATAVSQAECDDFT